MTSIPLDISIELFLVPANAPQLVYAVIMVWRENGSNCSRILTQNYFCVGGKTSGVLTFIISKLAKIRKQVYLQLLSSEILTPAFNLFQKSTLIGLLMKFKDAFTANVYSECLGDFVIGQNITWELNLRLNKSQISCPFRGAARSSEVERSLMVW